MRLFLLLGIILLCFGCKNETNVNVQEDIQIMPLDSLSKKSISLDLLKLSTQAEKDLSSFEDFKNLKNLTQTMRGANPFHVRKYADSINGLIQTFEENLSEDLNVNTINARITILLTEAGLLRQLTEQKHPESEKVLDANTRLITAYNSLIIQLNELSLAIPENIEKELLRELENKEE
ncbi:hypothetical protein [Aquimarina sp. AU474]|uniref:hypothetical protein n=1 Tax=Aquimarina sp. AU474 TaxID=2108529 RepID=UPI000D686843|nr:hypothetical protein [Aquimarina sp. AU474]